MMDPAEEIAFIRSREVNTTMGGAKGIFREIFGEGIKPLAATLLASAAAGAVIGGLILGGAALFGADGAVASITSAFSSAFGVPLGVGGFIGTAAAAGAALTTAMIGTKGYLDGRHAALEQNQVLENAANLLKSDLTVQGAVVANNKLQEQVAQKEGSAAGYIKNILAAGKRASPMGHAQALMEERSVQSFEQPHK